MKKSIKIFISLLSFIFFAQVCFASYAINPEVQKSITEYAEKQANDDESKYEKRQKIVKVVKIVGVVVLILVVVNLVVYLVALIMMVNAMSGRGA